MQFYLLCSQYQQSHHSSCLLMSGWIPGVSVLIYDLIKEIYRHTSEFNSVPVKSGCEYKIVTAASSKTLLRAKLVTCLSLSLRFKCCNNYWITLWGSWIAEISSMNSCWSIVKTPISIVDEPVWLFWHQSISFSWKEVGDTWGFTCATTGSNSKLVSHVSFSTDATVKSLFFHLGN